jgi:hypothetical protein
MNSPRSGRQHKAWGVSPRKVEKIIRAREVGESVSRFIKCPLCRPLCGLILVWVLILGFRCAPPQALCCHLLRRLGNLAIDPLSTAC